MKKEQNKVKAYYQAKARRNLIYKAYAEALYLEYACDFLTVARFAEYYGIDTLEAARIIDEGRHWNHLPKIEAVGA